MTPQKLFSFFLTCVLSPHFLCLSSTSRMSPRLLVNRSCLFNDDENFSTWSQFTMEKSKFSNRRTFSRSTFFAQHFLHQHFHLFFANFPIFPIIGISSRMKANFHSIFVATFLCFIYALQPLISNKHTALKHTQRTHPPLFPFNFSPHLSLLYCNLS